MPAPQLPLTLPGGAVRAELQFLSILRTALLSCPLSISVPPSLPSENSSALRLLPFVSPGGPGWSVFEGRAGAGCAVGQRKPQGLEEQEKQEE